MSYTLNPDDVIAYNATLGNAVIDRGKLESALARPLATFGGKLLHSTIIDQAAALLDGLCQAHAFTDGNKRVAWVATLIYLASNRYIMLAVPDADAADFVIEVVEHRHSLNEIADWLQENTIRV